MTYRPTHIEYLLPSVRLSYIKSLYIKIIATFSAKDVLGDSLVQQRMMRRFFLAAIQVKIEMLERERVRFYI
jgi:hypothetical protein